ncbi:MAG TPA: MmcQ/YjbR family DNA-binding protein [Thermoanaerobaculia bacterium]|nr:MmcQ/YjbR family DNA-binding protein [Thermoanaerobaculia bacterium]
MAKSSRPSPTRKPARAKKSKTRKTPRAAVLARVRKLCLGLPEAYEKIAWGAPTFRVKDRQFAMYLDNHHGDGRLSLWCKAPPGAQEALVEADPERFFVPPYVGPAGWLGIELDRGLDWGVVAGLVRDAYLEAAPPRLRAALDAR